MDEQSSSGQFERISSIEEEFWSKCSDTL